MVWFVLQGDVKAWVHSMCPLQISRNGAYLVIESTHFVVMASANAACNKGSICATIIESDKSKKHLPWR